MVEGWIWHNGNGGGDQSTPNGYYGGCLVTLADKSYTVGDAANEAMFIRVALDGTLYEANNNNPPAAANA